MLYIIPEDRNPYLKKLMDIKFIRTKGDLEYCITCLMKVYMKTREWKYTDLHDCVYATIHAGDEFRRRHLDPYEEQKRRENGDVIC